LSIRQKLLLLMVRYFIVMPIFLTISTPYKEKDSIVTIIVGTTDSVTTIDPADCYDYFSSNILVQITHGLMEMPIDSMRAEKSPIIASYTVSADATEYTFYLKSNIKFSDGTPLNSTVVKWCFDRVLNLPGGAPAFLLTEVVNNVEVIDENTVKIILKFADATFLQRLTYTVGWIIKPGSLPFDELSGRSEDTLPIGCGPYMIDSWTKDVELILVPNPEYFGDAPKNDKVVIKFYPNALAMLTALENGDIDVAHRDFGPEEMTSVIDNDNLEYATKSSIGIRYFLINVDMYDDINVRRALAAAINRSEITSTIFNSYNEPLFSMVPKIFSSHVDAFMDGPDQDSVEGNMTLSGYSTTNKFDIEMWYTPTHYGDTEDDVALFLEDQFEATGFFDVTVKSAEWSTYLSQLTSMGFFLLGWWFDYPDPSNYINPFVSSGSSLGTMYSSSVMDNYIDTLVTDPDASNRREASILAQELMAEDVPCIPLFTMPSQFTAYHKDIIGLTLEPSENLHYNTLTFVEIPSTTSSTETSQPITQTSLTTSERSSERSLTATSEGQPQITLGWTAPLLLVVLMTITLVQRDRKR
jgi:peptide/nickel transport system substrate-binding protein